MAKMINWEKILCTVPNGVSPNIRNPLAKNTNFFFIFLRYIGYFNLHKVFFSLVNLFFLPSEICQFAIQLNYYSLLEWEYVTKFAETILNTQCNDSWDSCQIIILQFASQKKSHQESNWDVYPEKQVLVGKYFSQFSLFPLPKIRDFKTAVGRF